VPCERITPYLTQFASKEALEARHRVAYRFFQTRDRAEAWRSSGASYVALYGHDRIRIDASGPLEPVHDEPGARLYPIREPDAERSKGAERLVDQKAAG
jgi:hypothetical protein